MKNIFGTLKSAAVLGEVVNAGAVLDDFEHNPLSGSAPTGVILFCSGVCYVASSTIFGFLSDKYVQSRKKTGVSICVDIVVQIGGSSRMIC